MRTFGSQRRPSSHHLGPRFTRGMAPKRKLDPWAAIVRESGDADAEYVWQQMHEQEGLS